MDTKYLLKLSRLLKLVVEVSTNRGILIAQAEQLTPGTEVFTPDEKGNLVPPLDGEYEITNPNGSIVLVTIEGGLISTMEEKELNDGTGTENEAGNIEAEKQDETSGNGSDNGEGDNETGSDNGSDTGSDDGKEEEKLAEENDNGNEELVKENEALKAKVAELEEKLAELQKKIDEVEPSAEEAEKFEKQKPEDKRMEKIQRAVEMVKYLNK